MWEFPGAADEHKFLIIARWRGDQMTGESGRPVPPRDLSAELRERLILYGALTTLHDAGPVGIALAVQAPSRDAVDGLLKEGRLRLDTFPDVEIHDWEFGGRR
jgi:hypothetical protein